MPSSPRSSWTNKLIQARDFASVQINIGHLDESGIYNGKMTTYALSGYVRAHVSSSWLLSPSASASVSPRAPCCAIMVITLTCCLHVQGEGDSAIDIMWAKKKDSITDY